MVPEKKAQRVIVFNSQRMTYADAKKAVAQIKPRVVFHCSDEGGEATNWFWGTQQFLYLKQYSHGRFFAPSNNKVQIPLGFMTGAFQHPPWNQEVMNITKRSIPWSFVGNLKQDRFHMLEEFTLAMPQGLSKTDGSVSPQEMSAIYNSSVFVPNGRGQVSLDCFRLYEAIFAGCIPVIVSTQQELKKLFPTMVNIHPF